MSPRAACQLEAMGFDNVYDFVGGKLEWLSRGWPTEGIGPHYFTAGEVARTEVPTCRYDETSSDVRERLRHNPEPFCIVVTEEGVVLGRVRARDLPDEDHLSVSSFMRPGPATVQASEELRPLVGRMRTAGVGTILVTTPQGIVAGIVYRSDAEQALSASSP